MNNQPIGNAFGILLDELEAAIISATEKNAVPDAFLPNHDSPDVLSPTITWLESFHSQIAAMEAKWKEGPVTQTPQAPAAGFAPLRVLEDPLPGHGGSFLTR